MSVIGLRAAAAPKTANLQDPLANDIKNELMRGLKLTGNITAHDTGDVDARTLTLRVRGLKPSDMQALLARVKSQGQKILNSDQIGMSGAPVARLKNDVVIISQHYWAG